MSRRHIDVFTYLLKIKSFRKFFVKHLDKHFVIIANTIISLN